MPDRKLTLEWMHRFESIGLGTGFGYGTVRVWAKRTGHDEAEFKEQQRQIIDCLQAHDVMGGILALPFVTACEHLDCNGNGQIVYVDWP